MNDLTEFFRSPHSRSLTVRELLDLDETGKSEDTPFAALALLGITVVDIRTPKDGQHSLALTFDLSDALVLADRLLHHGDPLGVPFAQALLRRECVAVFNFEADCCSETWLADVVNPQALIGERLLAARSVELPEHLKTGCAVGDKDSRTRQEYDAVYGWEFVTRKGVCTVAVRNSSNGYYGGWVEFEHLATIEDVSAWTSITEDWSA